MPVAHRRPVPRLAPVPALMALLLTCCHLLAQDPANDRLPPLGTRLMGSTQVMYIPGETCRFLFDDGLDPREYVLDLDALPIQRGNVHVYETSSGTWPILRGGVARRGIDGNILWSTEMTYEPGYEVLMDAPVFDGTTLSIHYLETWQGATAGKTVAYSLHGKTLVVDVTADGGIAPGNGSYAALDVGRTIMEDPRSVLLPYNSEPVLVGDGIFVSKYADLTVSHGNTIWAAGPILDPWLGPGIRHPHYPAYLPDSAGMVQPLRERLYITVSANVEDVFVASDVVAGPGRDQLAARVVYDTWGVDESPLRRSPFSTPFHEQLLHFQRLATAFGMTEMQVLRHNWGSDDDFAYPKIYPASLASGGDLAFRGLCQGTQALGWLFAAHENLTAMFGPNPYVSNPAWYDPEKVSLDANLNGRAVYWIPYRDTAILALAIDPADQLGFVQAHASYLRASYGTNAGFWDIAAYSEPLVNLDAGDRRAPTYAQAVRDIRSAVLEMKAIHQGPVSGEAFAMDHSWDLAFAGYFDALERELVDGEQGLVIPDVELRVFQPLQANQGMGYLSRFFASGTRAESDFPAARHHDLIRSRAVAYGHTGFISDTMMADPREIVAGVKQARTFALHQILEEYFLFQALQSRMLSSGVESVLYLEGSALHTLSDRLQELRLGSGSQTAFVDAVRTAFRRSRVLITYESGLQVAVNAHPDEDWLVSIHGSTLRLPPNGWLARDPAGTFETSLARSGLAHTDPVVARVRAPEYEFFDDRPGRKLTILFPGRYAIILPY